MSTVAINQVRVSYIRRPFGWEGCLRNARGLVTWTCGHVHQVRGYSDRFTGAETCARLNSMRFGVPVIVNVGRPFTGTVIRCDGFTVYIRRDVPYIDQHGKEHFDVSVPVHRVDPHEPGFREVP